MTEISRPPLPTAEVLSYAQGLQNLEERLSTHERPLEVEALIIGAEEIKSKIESGDEFPTPIEPIR